MFSPEQLNSISKTIMEKLGGNGTRGCSSDKPQDCNVEKKQISLTPVQLLVIMGIITGSLDIDSLLVDKNQEIQILLVGSLKQKTSLEKMFDDVGKMPFDDVLRALMGRL